MPEDKRLECYTSMIQDAFYLFNGNKPNNYQTIKCINGNIYDLDNHLQDSIHDSCYDTNTIIPST